MSKSGGRIKSAAKIRIQTFKEKIRRSKRNRYRGG